MFHGKYANVRQCLDYTFHKHYLKERQLLQDAIICKAFAGKDPVGAPKLYLTAGAMGAGKTHTIRDLLKESFSCYVIADVDRVTHQLPEMKRLLKDDPYNAGKILHSEACTIHELIFRKAVQDRYDVIIDSSLRNGSFYEKFLFKVKAEGIYEIIIVHVIASLETCLRRAEQRAKETGRHVPRSSIEQSVRECPKAVELLSDLADGVITVYND